MRNREIEQEIIKKYVVPNKQERILWELQNPKKQENIMLRKFAGAELFKKACLQPMEVMSKQGLECELLRMGKAKGVYYISDSYIGELSLKPAVEKAFFGEICIIYCGNGVGYYQGEEELGSVPRFLLK